MPRDKHITKNANKLLHVLKSHASKLCVFAWLCIWDSLENGYQCFVEILWLITANNRINLFDIFGVRNRSTWFYTQFLVWVCVFCECLCTLLKRPCAKYIYQEQAMKEKPHFSLFISTHSDNLFRFLSFEYQIYALKNDRSNITNCLFIIDILSFCVFPVYLFLKMHKIFSFNFQTKLKINTHRKREIRIRIQMQRTLRSSEVMALHFRLTILLIVAFVAVLMFIYESWNI